MLLPLRCAGRLILILFAIKASSVCASDAHLLRGVFYYHYLNSDYQLALDSLEQWRRHSPGQHYGSEDSVMEAAIYLALGLEDDAEKLYQQVEKHGGFARADAWFHLARRWFQHGAWRRAEQSIQRCLEQQQSLNADYYQQALFLRLASRVNQNNVKDAASLLLPMDTISIWAGLARYNWMLALMRLNASSRDIEVLVDEAVFYLPEKGMEASALRDRILLTAGLHALNSGKNRRAEDYLKKISLDSAYTAPGLLHYGWSLVEQWKYEEALQPWRILQQRYKDFHPEVMESILGVPHILELLNATTQSLRTYEVVEKRLENMLVKLSTLHSEDTLNAWLDGWLVQQHEQNWGWMRSTLSEQQDSDITRVLQPMLHDDSFVMATSQLHDLNQIINRLSEAQLSLNRWQALLIKRQNRLRQLKGKQRLASLEKRYRKLLQQVQKMEHKLHREDQKIFAYASPDDQKNIRLLFSVVANTEYLQAIATPTRDLNIYKERWRRIRGLQLWKVHENKPSRRLQASDSLLALHTQTKKLMTQLENSRQSLSWSNSSWKGFPVRVNRQQQALEKIKAKTRKLYERQRQLTIALANNYMNSLKERVTDYLAQTRLSIARLYDEELQRHVASSDFDKSNRGDLPEKQQSALNEQEDNNE